MTYRLHVFKRLSVLTLASIFAFAFTIGGYIANAAAPGQNSFYCGFVELGRNGCHGYVTNTDFYVYSGSNQDVTENNVIIYNVNNLNGNALPATINSAASFIALYEADLARGSPSRYDYNSLGAAVTIDSMLGVDGSAVCQWYTSDPATTTCTWSAAIAYAQDAAHLNDWVARINYYASKGWIIWNQSIFKQFGYPDSGHACFPTSRNCWQGRMTDPPAPASADARDIVWKGVNANDFGLSNAIVFVNPDGSSFALDRYCGNFLGQIQALATPVPPATVSCAGFTASIAAPDPSRPFTLQASVRYSPASAAASFFGPDSMVTTLSGPAPYRSISQRTTSPSISNGVATATLNVPPTDVSGIFTLTWRVTGPWTPTVTCTAPVTVALQPYFTITGGDVSAGQGFGSNCTDDPTADLKGVNRDNGSAPANYFGAGASQAALATGSISGFSTDLTNDLTNNVGGSTDGLAAHLPKGLTGSNNLSDPSEYGGHFLGSYAGNWCVPDYASGAGGTADYTSQPDWNRLPPKNGSYLVRLFGDQTLGNITLQPGVRVTVVVAGGSVFLNGNIMYGAYGGRPAAEIPQFDLLVPGGNIFIDPHVSELHGFYDAQPSGSSNGQIFTCANGNSITSVLKNYDDCSAQPLDIYGAVSARQLIFGRTVGNIASSGSISGQPAERIIYTPELWLGSISAPSTSCSQDPVQSQCLYQSYTSLPPVL